MSCCHCIVPPELLEGIANSEHNSDQVRAEARAGLEARRRLMTARRENRVTVHHHATPGPRNGGVVPRDLLQHIADSDAVDQTTRARARRDLESLAQITSPDQEPFSLTKDTPYRYIYDCHNTQTLRGTLVRTEGQPPVDDEAVNDVYDSTGRVLQFYREFCDWNSIDNKNMDVISSVHYGIGFGNAFWNGKQMTYGDGSKLLYNFTKVLDVIGHEISHGVTQFVAPLSFGGQPGALNEHISDVFGIMVKQWTEQVKTDDDDWLIGEGVLMPGVKGVALRSMMAPGTAYDDPKLGKDPQPDHMKDFKVLSMDARGDYGGVHVNCGIPNKAFYNAAKAFGGFSYEIAGQIWWKARTSGKVPYNCTFQQFADITVDCAKELGRDAARAVRKAWVDVGVERDI